MENYPLINAACGLNAGEMVVTEEGTHMNAPLLDSLEAKLGAQEQQIAELKEAGNQNQEAIDAAVAKANEEHTTAVETLNTEHAQAIEALNAEHGTAVEALNARIAELEAAAAAHSTEMQQVKDALATAEQTIADRDAQIKQLTTAPAPAQPQGEAPANNGAQAEAPKFACGAPQYDATKSPLENRRIMDEYRKSLCK